MVSSRQHTLPWRSFINIGVRSLLLNTNSRAIMPCGCGVKDVSPTPDLLKSIPGRLLMLLVLDDRP